MRHLIRDSRWLTAPLTVWFAAVACAVGVTHAHSGGTVRHVHGHGWNVCGCPDLPDDSPDGSEPHRHLVWFGMELPGEPVPTAVTVGVQVVADQPSVDGPAALSPVIGSAALPPVLIEPPPGITDSTRFPHSPRLSTVALRTVCGVLRA